MIEHLARDYDDFTYQPILEDLAQCKSDNGDVECELYLVGHSQGGVYAQAVAVSLLDYIQESQGKTDYFPFIFAFGSPAGFMDHGCDSAYLDEDKLYNFFD